MSSLFSLAKKKILITGASSGIGKETSILLSNIGAELIICGRDEVRLMQTKVALKDSEKHKTFIGDLNDEAAIETLFTMFDKLDGLVLAAGIVKTKPIKFLDYNELLSTMNTNFMAPVMLIQKASRKKKINKGGSIVFISSIAGNFLANRGNGAYSASKSALTGICKVMALEFSNQKIRVNAICPGMVKTPMTEETLAAVTKEQMAFNESLYPLGYGTPEDVAASVAFFMSDGSKWVTGTSFVIDGGFTIV